MPRHDFCVAYVHGHIQHSNARPCVAINSTRLYYRIAGFFREDFNLAIGSIRDIKIRDHFICDIL